eukprot:1378091-Amorphochlora_amoeboformis.AAC.1
MTPARPHPTPQHDGASNNRSNTIRGQHPFEKHQRSQNQSACNPDLRERSPPRPLPSGRDSPAIYSPLILLSMVFVEESLGGNVLQLSRLLEVENSGSCAVCGRHFGSGWLLRNHMRKHTGEKPYMC